MKHGHLIALGAIVLANCQTNLRDGWSLYVDGGIGRNGASALFSLRKEIAGGQESWYLIPWVNYEKRNVGVIMNHGVSNNYYSHP